MKRVLYILATILFCSTAGFSQVNRGVITDGKTITLNESHTYKFKVEEGNKLNFYENSTLLT